MASDLGTGYGASRYEVDMAFKESPFDNGRHCLACGQQAKYRLIAKNKSKSTAQIEDRGYVCEYHLQFYDPNEFGIREV